MLTTAAKSTQIIRWPIDQVKRAYGWLLPDFERIRCSILVRSIWQVNRRKMATHDTIPFVCSSAQARRRRHPIYSGRWRWLRWPNTRVPTTHYCIESDRCRWAVGPGRIVRWRSTVLPVEFLPSNRPVEWFPWWQCKWPECTAVNRWRALSFAWMICVHRLWFLSMNVGPRTIHSIGVQPIHWPSYGMPSAVDSRGPSTWDRYRFHLHTNSWSANSLLSLANGAEPRNRRTWEPFHSLSTIVAIAVHVSLEHHLLNTPITTLSTFRSNRIDAHSKFNYFLKNFWIFFAEFSTQSVAAMNEAIGETMA